MAQRPIWVLKSKRTGTGRQHMALFAPLADYIDNDPNNKTTVCIGTKVHVTGAPMVGFCHEFQRNYDCNDRNLESASKIGYVDSKYVVDPQHSTFSTDQSALGKGPFDDLALRVPPPALTKDYLNPANAHNIRDCQNWVLDYINYLVKKHYLEPEAEQIVERLIDPQVGIGLRNVSLTK